MLSLICLEFVSSLQRQMFDQRNEINKKMREYIKTTDLPLDSLEISLMAMMSFSKTRRYSSTTATAKGNKTEIISNDKQIIR